MQSRTHGSHLLVVALLLGSMAILAACGSSSSGSSSSRPTASSILSHVKQQSLKDATFSLKENITTPNGTLTSNGTGKAMLNPVREQLNTTSNVSGQQVQSQEIVDGSTLYVKQSGQSMWTKTTVPAGQGYNAQQTSLSGIANVPNAKLVGKTTVNGVPVWHIQGGATMNASGTPVVGTPASGTPGANGAAASYTEDLYVRQDNYRPEEIVIHSKTGQGTVDSTIVFNSWNTGVSITPPPANQVTTPNG